MTGGAFGPAGASALFVLNPPLPLPPPSPPQPSTLTPTHHPPHLRPSFAGGRPRPATPARCWSTRWPTWSAASCAAWRYARVWRGHDQGWMAATAPCGGRVRALEGGLAAQAAGENSRRERVLRCPWSCPLDPLLPTSTPPLTPTQTPDHWISYCEVLDGEVSNPDRKTAVHRRKVATYY